MDPDNNGRGNMDPDNNGIANMVPDNNGSAASLPCDNLNHEDYFAMSDIEEDLPSDKRECDEIGGPNPRSMSSVSEITAEARYYFITSVRQCFNRVRLYKNAVLTATSIAVALDRGSVPNYHVVFRTQVRNKRVLLMICALCDREISGNAPVFWAKHFGRKAHQRQAGWTMCYDEESDSYEVKMNTVDPSQLSLDSFKKRRPINKIVSKAKRLKTHDTLHEKENESIEHFLADKIAACEGNRAIVTRHKILLEMDPATSGSWLYDRLHMNESNGIPFAQLARAEKKKWKVRSRSNSTKPYTVNKVHQSLVSIDCDGKTSKRNDVCKACSKLGRSTSDIGKRIWGKIRDTKKRKLKKSECSGKKISASRAPNWSLSETQLSIKKGFQEAQRFYVDLMDEKIKTYDFQRGVDSNLSSILRQVSTLNKEKKVSASLVSYLEDLESNAKKSKNAHSFSPNTKALVSVIYWYSGPTGVSLLHEHLGLPSVSSACRYIHSNSIRELGIPAERFARANTYYAQDSVKYEGPFVLASDDTPVIPSIQYETHSDRCIGARSGPSSQLGSNAVNAAEVMTEYVQQNFGNEYSAVKLYLLCPVVSGFRPYIVGIEGVERSFSSKEFSHKMEMCLLLAQEYRMKILGIGSDGASYVRKYWLEKTVNVANGPIPIQLKYGAYKVPGYRIPVSANPDPCHLLKKGRNNFINGRRLLVLGNCVALSEHYYTMLCKNKACCPIFKTDLFVSDKQNYPSAVRLFSGTARNLLEESTNEYEDIRGSLVYSQMMDNLILAASPGDATPAERVGYAWETATFFRHWREYIQHHENYKLHTNFVSNQFYNDIILFAHALPTIILQLYDNDYFDMEFHPWRYGSNDCETFFSCLRACYKGQPAFTLVEFLARSAKLDGVMEITAGTDVHIMSQRQIRSNRRTGSDPTNKKSCISLKEHFKNVNRSGLVRALSKTLSTAESRAQSIAISLGMLPSVESSPELQEEKQFCECDAQGFCHECILSDDVNVTGAIFSSETANSIERIADSIEQTGSLLLDNITTHPHRKESTLIQFDGQGQDDIQRGVNLHAELPNDIRFSVYNEENVYNVYHEQQYRGFCGLHAINAIVGFNMVTPRLMNYFQVMQREADMQYHGLMGRINPNGWYTSETMELTMSFFNIMFERLANVPGMYNVERETYSPFQEFLRSFTHLNELSAIILFTGALESGHWVTLYRVDENNWILVDPLSRLTNRPITDDEWRRLLLVDRARAAYGIIGDQQTRRPELLQNRDTIINFANDDFGPDGTDVHMAYYNQLDSLPDVDGARIAVNMEESQTSTPISLDSDPAVEEYELESSSESGYDYDKNSRTSKSASRFRNGQKNTENIFESQSSVSVRDSSRSSSSKPENTTSDAQKENNIERVMVKNRLKKSKRPKKTKESLTNRLYGMKQTRGGDRLSRVRNSAGVPAYILNENLPIPESHLRPGDLVVTIIMDNVCKIVTFLMVVMLTMKKGKSYHRIKSADPTDQNKLHASVHCLELKRCKSGRESRTIPIPNSILYGTYRLDEIVRVSSTFSKNEFNIDSEDMMEMTSKLRKLDRISNRQDSNLRNQEQIDRARELARNEELARESIRQNAIRLDGNSFLGHTMKQITSFQQTGTKPMCMCGKNRYTYRSLASFLRHVRKFHGTQKSSIEALSAAVEKGKDHI